MTTRRGKVQDATIGQGVGLSRRAFLGLAAAVGVWPALARADEADRVAEGLRRAGYRNIRTERTLLNRTRITADGPDGRREIVVDRGTGEILRDLTEPAPPDPGTGGNGSQ